MPNTRFQRYCIKTLDRLGIHMAHTMPATHHEIVQRNQRQLIASIEHGELKPFFLWNLLVLFGLPLFALMTLRYKGSRYIRLGVFALIVSVAFEIIKCRRALLGASGYMIGVVACYWVVWSAVLLIFNDVGKNFKRIERRAISANTSKPDSSGFIDMDKGGDIHAADPDDNAISSSKNSGTQRSGDAGKISTVDEQPSKGLLKKSEVFTWQSYPQPFLHRLNWTFDLLSNTRGPQWNWRISPMGPLPASVHAQLNPGKRDASREANDSDVLDAKTRLKTEFASFWKSYLALDLLKVLMMRDPYFQGVVSPAPPPPFPFNYLPDIPVIIALYRHLITGFGIFAALNYATSFNPIIFLGLSMAFPDAARTLTSVPLDAPWLYSDAFGPFVITVLDQGLAGCWGQWWHQLFRAGFTNTGRWLLSFLPEKLATKRNVRRIVMTFVAFGLSGIIHACGSHTQLGDTNPLGPFMFFIMQAVGIVIEDTFKRVILPVMFPYNIPRWLRWTANSLFVASWLFFSGHFVADDFARGGVWITEPVPFSPLRGLGLGVKGESWLTWEKPWFRSWKGDRWWERGLAVL